MIINLTRKYLHFFNFLLWLNMSNSFASNCTIENDVIQGDCPKSKSTLIVKSSITEVGVIGGAIIYNAGNLDLRGISNGDITVYEGGNLSVSGHVNATVINDGGTVDIKGHVKFLQGNSGNSSVEGFADHATGRINLKKGSIVNGIMN